MKKKQTKFAQFKKKHLKHFKWNRETKGLVGSFCAIAAFTVVATIFQFAKSDEFSDLDALLAEVEGTALDGAACNAMIEGAELTKRHMFRPYRQEIEAMTRDQQTVALGVMRDVVKDIPRDDWMVMASTSANLRRIAVARARVDLARQERRRRIETANADLASANAIITNAQREELRLILGDPTVGTHTIRGELSDRRRELEAVNAEANTLQETINTADRSRLNAVSVISGIDSTNRMEGDTPRAARFRRAFERRTRTCTGTRASRPACQELRRYNEAVELRTAMEQRLVEANARMAELNAQRTELETRIAALEASRTEIQARYRTQHETAETANRTFVEGLEREITALDERFTRIESLRIGLERQLNIRGRILADFLQQKHEEYCRRDHFMTPQTLAVRYNRESWLTGMDSEGRIPFVGECLRYSQSGYDSHDGTLQTCRILPRLERLENEIVDQAGGLLGADFYRACVQIDLARIDESFFRADGEFDLAQVRQILVPTEDWIHMTNRERGHLAYDVIDTVANQLTSACRDAYLERRFHVPAPVAATPAVVAPSSAPAVVAAPVVAPVAAPVAAPVEGLTPVLVPVEINRGEVAPSAPAAPVEGLTPVLVPVEN